MSSRRISTAIQALQSKPLDPLPPFLTPFHLFWIKHPALYLSLFILLGSLSSLYGFEKSCLPLTVLLLPALLNLRAYRVRLLIVFPLFALSYCQVHYKVTFPLETAYELQKGISGEAVLAIDSLSLSHNHFGRSWCYRSTLRSFSKESTLIAKNIPVTIYIPFKKDHSPPKADSSYRVQGVLKQNPLGSYQFKPLNRLKWQRIKSHYRFAQTRFNIKQFISCWIEKNVPNQAAGHLLSGLATGEFSDRTLHYEFGRFGLLHIMAISGFHFAIIASILGMILQLFFDKKSSAIALTLLLSSYFLLIGPSPSVVRAWMMSMLTIIGGILGKDTFALNSLGLALGALVLYDPLICHQIGFQLSFLVTGAILLLVPAITLLLSNWRRAKPLEVILKESRSEQLLQIFFSFFKPMIVLTIAVHLVIIPLSLQIFHKFPLLSLLYNLFIPFLISLSMLLLILAAFTFPLLPVAQLLFKVNSYFTYGVIQLLQQTPTVFDYKIYSQGIGEPFLSLYLLALFIGGIQLSYLSEKKSVQPNLPTWYPV